MARRLFLHVGTPKSGTSYLQSLWWRHRDVLADRGLLVPGRRPRDHFHAANVVAHREEALERMGADHRRAWERLLAEVAGWSGDALISHELLAPATAPRADKALREAERAAEEVHLLVTARDLARQVASDWQQNVKQGRTLSLREFWQFVQEPSADWWRLQDVADVLDRWGRGLPPDRLHLVVLPRSDRTPRTWLWEQACGVLGVEHADLSTETTGANASLGLVETELLRRILLEVPEAERGMELRQLAKGWVSRQLLAGTGDREPFVLPADIHAAAADRAVPMVRTLQDRDLDLTGDLTDLLPDPEPGPGRSPEEVTDGEVATAAARALSRLVLRERDRRSRG